MSSLPTGTVTFLFTDVEGSTDLLRRLGPVEYGRAQDAHAVMMRTAIERAGGVEIRTVGDAFFVAFSSAADAVTAAVDAQRRLAGHAWPNGCELRVRMGLHTGEGALGGDDYVSIDVNRAARVSATGHGGQVVLSEPTRALVDAALPSGTAIRSLGSHRLKDFDDPIALHDLVIDGLPVEFAPLRSLDAPRTNLRAPRTSLVGRDDEVAATLAALDRARLVTLTGPGGIGKTRLALEVARRRLDTTEDEAYVVDLSGVHDPSLIVAEIAATLRLRDQPGTDPVAFVGSVLRDRPMLLVIDNLEQLLDGVGTIAELLDAAFELRVLATSRIPLHLSGEHVVAVGPLRLPEDGDPPDALTGSDAAHLFLDRAASVRPDLELGRSNADAIAHIVAQLDGHPLALELAATQLRVLDLPDLADRLARHLPLPAGGPRDAPDRQRTLDAAITWSYEALGDDERTVFERLSVFESGWTLAAADAVVGEGVDLLGELGSLIDQSLVRRIEGAAGTRYAMLETIRTFAGDRLAERPSGDRDALVRRHAAWYRAVSESAEPHLNGDQQTTWFATLTDEHANLRAAFERAEAADDPALTAEALQIAAAIWRFWHAHGHLTEGRATLDRLLALPSAQAPTAERARALGALGSVEYWMLDHDAMRSHYAAAVEIARELGDRRLLSAALFNASFEHVPTGDLPAHLAAVEEALEVADPDDHLLLAQIWMGIGFNHVMRGDGERGIEPIERSIELYRRADDLALLCEALTARAAVAYVLGDLPGAIPWLDEAIAIAAATPAPQVVGRVLYPQAVADTALGRYERSATLLGAHAAIEEAYDLHFPESGVAFLGDPAEPARAGLGEEAFDRAFAAGRAMSMTEVLGFLTAEG